jgi:hypothetical protein
MGQLISQDRQFQKSGISEEDIKENLSPMINETNFNNSKGNTRNCSISLTIRDMFQIK